MAEIANCHTQVDSGDCNRRKIMYTNGKLYTDMVYIEYGVNRVHRRARFAWARTRISSRTRACRCTGLSNTEKLVTARRRSRRHKSNWGSRKIRAQPPAEYASCCDGEDL